MLNSESFAKYLYGLFPEIYRIEDAKNYFVLYQYLKATVDGGYTFIIDYINSFKDLSDPEKCPDTVFPYLYESFGLTYQPSIDIKYQRKILKNIGELNKRRGTYNSIRYLVRVLTQLDIDLRNEKTYNNGIPDRKLHIVLKANSLSQIQEMDNNIAVVQNFVKSHIPYNVTPIVEAEVSTQVLESKQYYANAISQGYFYNLVPIN
jgi:P2-related tail formation protein